MFLYILLGFAVAFILAQAYLLYIFVGRITDLSEKLEVSDNAYEALDQGMIELTDAYETDSLQYESTIETLNEQFGLSEGRVAEKHGKILRQNNMIDDLQIQVATIRGENLHLRRQLDMAQVIITNHDLNCLPHIVLSHMEAQKDTPLPMDCESVEF